MGIRQTEQSQRQAPRGFAGAPFPGRLANLHAAELNPAEPMPGRCRV
jgi:hypothetical protein